jgi:hypothetical protein
VRLHADLGGRIKENQAQAKRLAQDMRHVEAVLKMLDPGYNVRAIAPRRRVTGNPWLKRGTLFRHALEALRIAPGPMTVREIAAAVLAAKRIADATADQRKGIEAGLRASLEDHAGKSVERVGEGTPRRWRLIQLFGAP